MREGVEKEVFVQVQMTLLLINPTNLTHIKQVA